MTTSYSPPPRVRIFGKRQPNRTKLESDLETEFRLAVRRLGGRTYKMIPATKGMPDRLFCLPGGIIRVVELKTEAGTVSPKQRLVHEQMAEVGTIVHVIYGVAGVASWVAEHTNPHN